jgi:hypothetical protein
MSMNAILSAAAVSASGVLALAGATPASGGTGYPVSPLNNTQTFFNDILAGESGTVTITGDTYNYNPADGALVMEVVVNNQQNVCNGCGNGYFQADYTGADVLQSFSVGFASEGPVTGALVTQFNAGPTLGTFNGDNCAPFNCNGSGSSVGLSWDYFEIYNPAAFGGPIAINSISFFEDSFDLPDTVLYGEYNITFSTLAVPEPAAWALMLLGFGGLGAALRSSCRKAAASA